jgi:hypothetical protein
VVSTTLNIAFYITGVISKYVTNDKVIEMIILFSSFMMLFGRGIFIMASIFKGLRIHLALKCNLEKYPNCVKILQSEKYLIILVIILSIFIWCIPYLIWRAKDYNPDILI